MYRFAMRYLISFKVASSSVIVPPCTNVETKLLYLQMYRLTIRASKDGVAKVLNDMLETQF